MPNYLGTATGLTGIPSLLISNLTTIKDPEIQKALYQVQNWANSFLPVIATSDLFLATNSTASTTFVNFSLRPGVEVTTGQSALVVLTANMGQTLAGNSAIMSFSVSGATTIAPTAIPDPLVFEAPTNNGIGTFSSFNYVTLNAGKNLFVAQYRAGPGGTASFVNAMVTVFPTTKP